MAWIESHPELESHPKVYDLMSQLGLDLDQAIGKIHRFWWWCTKYAEDGDLRKHNDDRMARAVGLNGGQEAARLIQAMISSGWIDREPYFRVHDWWDYFGYFLMRKYADAPEKWRRIKNLYVTVHGSVQLPSPPSLAVPNQPTKPRKHLPASKKKEAGDPRLRLLIDEFHKLLSAKLGEPPAFNGGAAAKGFKKLLGHYTPEEIQRRFDAWFRSNREFIVSNSHRVELFFQHFNSLKGGPLVATESITRRGYIGAEPIAEKYAAISENGKHAAGHSHSGRG